MRRPVKRRVLAVLGMVTALLMSGWGTGESAAQEHDHDPPPTVPGSTTSTTSGSTTPGARTANLRYGPFTIPAAVNPDGSHGHAHTGNQFQFFAQKPCGDCYVTGMKANLTYADGSTAAWNTDAQLHHMVLFNWAFGRSDATCGASFLGFLGERFFASGDERTPILAPPGYGYYVGPWDAFNLIYELAGTRATAQTVYINMTYQWVPASTPGMTQVDPVWFDVDQCGDSEYSAPAGPSDTHWTWTVNRPGKVIGTGGHLHDGGVNLDIVNDTTGQRICNSVAGYGESPMYIDHHGNRHISSMSTCRGTREQPITTLTTGQRVTIHANYNLAAPADDIMGIAIMYIGRS